MEDKNLCGKRRNRMIVKWKILSYKDGWPNAQRSEDWSWPKLKISSGDRYSEEIQSKLNEKSEKG